MCCTFSLINIPRIEKQLSTLVANLNPPNLAETNQQHVIQLSSKQCRLPNLTYCAVYTKAEKTTTPRVGSRSQTHYWLFPFTRYSLPSSLMTVSIPAFISSKPRLNGTCLFSGKNAAYTSIPPYNLICTINNPYSSGLTN